MLLIARQEHVVRYIAMSIELCRHKIVYWSYFIISCYLLLPDVLIDPDVGSEDTEMLGEGLPRSATEK